MKRKYKIYGRSWFNWPEGDEILDNKKKKEEVMNSISIEKPIDEYRKMLLQELPKIINLETPKEVLLGIKEDRPKDHLQQACLTLAKDVQNILEMYPMCEDKENAFKALKYLYKCLDKVKFSIVPEGGFGGWGSFYGFAIKEINLSKKECEYINELNKNFEGEIESEQEI